VANVGLLARFYKDRSSRWPRVLLGLLESLQPMLRRTWRRLTRRIRARPFDWQIDAPEYGRAHEVHVRIVSTSDGPR
jgi:hypothetical protein